MVKVKKYVVFWGAVFHLTSLTVVVMLHKMSRLTVINTVMSKEVTKLFHFEEQRKDDSSL